MSTAIQVVDLRFFAVLAAADSFGAAARELGVTTPAVSKHLTKIETRVGVLLLHRTTRHMSLTPAGELYLRHAHRILDEVDHLQEMLGAATKKSRERTARLAPSKHAVVGTNG